MFAPVVAYAQQAMPAAPAAFTSVRQAPPLVIDNVNVVDVEQGKVRPAQRVFAVGNRIQAVGGAGELQVPAGAQVVDGRGKYLIPGLWDMHAHVNEGGRERYPRYIAHGVTGLREMGQRFPNGSDSFRVWQREIMAGTQVGPRVVGPSPDVNGGGDIMTTDPADAARLMDSLKAAGVAFVKYHGGDDRALFFALMREARRVGLPIVGHVMASVVADFARPVTNVEASDSGLRSVEHIHENFQCWGYWPELEDSITAESPAMAEPCALMAKAYIRNETWITPTLALHERFPRLHQMFPGFGEDRGEPTAADSAERDRLHARDQAFIKRMRGLGFWRYLAGADAYKGSEVDAGLALHLPGLSLLWELVLLGEAGLTPLEALQAATLRPAQFFEATDSLGTVAPGKLADLVLLDANPLADIRNVTTIQAVVANGRYFDRRALNDLDPDGVALTKQVAEYPYHIARTP